MSWVYGLYLVVAIVFEVLGTTSMKLASVVLIIAGVVGLNLAGGSH